MRILGQVMSKLRVAKKLFHVINRLISHDFSHGIFKATGLTAGVLLWWLTCGISRCFFSEQICIKMLRTEFFAICLINHLPYGHGNFTRIGVVAVFGVRLCHYLHGVGLSCESGWFALIVLGLLLGVVLFIFLTEWGSLGSLLGVSGLSIVQLSVFFFRYADMVNVYLVCLYLIILSINILTWCAHHKNIARLFAGEEHHTSIKKLAKKKAGKKL